MRAAFVPAALALASVVLSIPLTARAEGGVPPEPAPVTPAADANEVAEARASITSALAQMRQTSRHAREELRLARKRGTARQIRCVDEALSRSDVALRRARDLSDLILDAYDQDSVQAARRARRRLTGLRQAQQQAAVEASECASRRAPVTVTSATTVTLRIDPAVAPAP